MTEILKTCSCGAAYTWETWRELKCLGIQLGLELRNCTECSSTMGERHSTSWWRLEVFQKSRKGYHDQCITGELVPEKPKHLYVGAAVHTLTLEGREKFNSEYVTTPKVPRNNGAGKAAHEAYDTGKEIVRGPCDAKNHKAWKLWTAEEDLSNAIAVLPKDYERALDYLDALRSAEGRTPLSRDEMDSIQRMADAVWDNPHARKILERKQALVEHEVHWTDPTGIEVFAHPDFMAPGIVADLKTTLDVRLESFSRSVPKFGYHRQAAMYTGHAHPMVFDPEKRRGNSFPFAYTEQPEFFWITVANTEPHDVAVYRASDDWLNLGHEQFRFNMGRLAACLKEGDWLLPESKNVHELSPEPWQYNKTVAYETMEDA